MIGIVTIQGSLCRENIPSLLIFSFSYCIIIQTLCIFIVFPISIRKNVIEIPFGLVYGFSNIINIFNKRVLN